MQTIGLLSDTHGWWDEKYATYFASCDEIWHAGDIGSADVALRLSAIRPLRAVCGNIDGYPVRQMYPKTLHFTVEDVSVMMTHIGGYPGRYEPAIRAELYETKPQLFVCGHSHILKVMFDKRLNCLCLNPGAAGKSGFHTVRTLMRFVIDGADIRDMEIIELAKR
ncbi:MULTISPECIES: metallophosphoesterase family protein [Tannerella]|uniref:Phosphodiesterase n=1 Tax=Tannerella forsythia TaxID=28112 RepID=A0A2A6E929_TANFO|nr:metallophosphoesterase family protein [Tannerella forsythia]KKY62171.1 phosphoesterase [Tannerella forsythia]PDP44509.1 phosphodiesterase [Tannerella forsythia]PDP71082.1 phosphodiesterase [Tannerella forsythia]TPE15632.1 metallophosphoesterase family protein [Tannerella forsythia]